MNRPQTRFLTREHAGFIELTNRGLDILGCVLASFLIASYVTIPAEYQRDWILLAVINTFAIMLAFQQAQLYRSWRGRPYSDQFSRLLLAWLLASFATWLTWMAAGLQHVITLPILGVWLATVLFLIISQRALLHITARRLRKKGGNAKQIVIYGAGRLGQSIAQQIERSPESGFIVVGFIDDNPQLENQSVGNVRVLGGFDAIAQLGGNDAIDELWIALPLSATTRVPEILEHADQKMICVRLFPDLYGLTLLNHSVSEMLGFPIIDLNVDRMQGLNRVIKDLEDKLLGWIFFLIALPLIGVIALLIRMTSPGPVIFRQRRNGWDGKPFTIYKFRTMWVHEEPDGQLTQARRDDPRFTPIGRWLRRTSFDELPQLFNVIQGKMSIVGPRPHAIEHDSFYQQHIEGYLRRNRVKPGITGWAQINDLRGEVQEIEEMSRRVKHDLYYIEHWSLWFDLRIILATILKIFFSKKAW